MTNDERLMVMGSSVFAALDQHGDDLAEFLNLAETLTKLTMAHPDQPDWVPLILRHSERLIASGEALEQAVRRTVPIPCNQP